MLRYDRLGARIKTGNSSACQRRFPAGHKDAGAFKRPGQKWSGF